MKTWTLNNHTLEFIPETHQYLCDGKFVPCVSDLLKCKFDDYSNVDKRILENASKLGSEMHKAIELYEKDGIKSDLKELRNYLFLKRAKGFENLQNEIPIIYEENGEVLYAGTMDQLLKTADGKLGINDFKRVATPNKEKIAYQLNLYKLGYECTYKNKIEVLTFMHLRDDKRKIYYLPIAESLTKELIKNFFKGELR